MALSQQTTTTPAQGHATHRQDRGTRRRILWGLALLAGVVLAVCGCERSRAPVRPHTFLVVGTSQDDPLWPVLQGGAQAFARTVSSLHLKMLAPPAADPQAQADLVRRSLDRGVFAVCLQATACEPTRRLIHELSGRGVSVVLIGQDIPDSERVAYVGLDDLEAGRLLAQTLRDSMHDRTTFMVLHAGEGNGPYGLRLRGFTVGMSEIGHLRQLHRVDCENDTAKARQLLAEQTRKYPNLGMWASVEDWPARIPAAELREVLGEQTGLVIIGALPPVWPLMRQGVVRAAVATNYGWWGYEAASLAELAFDRSPIPDRVRLTDPRIVLPTDLPAFEQTWQGWTAGHILPSPPASQPATAEGVKKWGGEEVGS